jgi:hypothetical protein
MSIGSSLGILSSLATTGFAQRAADIERVERDTADQARASDSQEKAETAAGVGEPEKESAIGDRDADGRRPWEFLDHRQHREATDAPPSEEHTARDPHGDAGNLLDISG